MARTEEKIEISNQGLDVIIANILRSKVKPNVDTTAILNETSQIAKKEDTDLIVKNTNNMFLMNVLSPEIKENEIKKREHKDKLMRAVSAFLLFQFIIVGLMIASILGAFIYCHILNNPFPDSTIQMFFTFIGVYITSVVVELIAILRCIVTNVFDTSIAALVKVFKDE